MKLCPVIPWMLILCIGFSCVDQPPRKIEILFLGHHSLHHNSEKYMPMLASALANQGVNFTYTAEPSDLNNDYLSKFDGLMVYSNFDSITVDQEQALMKYVESGKGFLPIHCASWCFRNSEKYVELVGAQFKSHGTGTFKAEVVNADHPVTRNFQPFESWDETYVSHKHNPDRTVLMERVDSTGREPWTWVRQHGKGRVFYTASGHDHRTWSHPGFQDLMLRAILWAVGDEVRASWEQLEIPEHRYVFSDNIANYEKREQPLMFQEPFDQADSEKLIQVPAGFQLKVFASEPDIVNPIFINWDEKGRLWVIETVDYPNKVNTDGKGNDRIKICEDTDGDGQADKFTIFAEGLNIPTSLVFSKGGVIVSAAPDFLYLKDEDGDDRADTKTVLISGWGTFDSHAGPSNLKYGFDNYIWGTVGYSAFKGQVAGRYYDFGQGIYRFNPQLTDFEFLTSTSNNTWGLGFSETFDVFASTANNAHSWYLGIPDRYLNDLDQLVTVGSKKIADYYAFHPITQNIRQVDVFGGFTAAAGHNLYTAREFPQKYWNSMALICEPTGNLLAQGTVEKDGAGFKLKDQWNLLASSDEWVSPVHAEVGPDGAVWVADWYNFIIQHNPTPTKERGGYQAETGAGNAHVNPLRDRSYGRVYRIVYGNSIEYNPLTLNTKNSNDLIKALKNDNLFWRLTAQRLLVENGDHSIAPELIELVGDTGLDEIGLNSGALHALWTLHGLGMADGNHANVNEAIIDALAHPAAGVRKAAVQVIPESNWAASAILEADLLNDPDAHTQLAALLRISEMQEDTNVGKALYALSQSETVAQDLWLSQALFVAANTHHQGFFAAYQPDTLAVNADLSDQPDLDQPPSVWDKWSNPSAITKNWPELQPGNPWEESVLADFDGRVILYKELEVKSKPEEAFIHLGKIGQSDWSFLNGTMLHETRNDPEKLRIYEVPVAAIQPGLNYILVSVLDDKGPGGLLGPVDHIYFKTNKDSIPITGAWKYYVQEKKSRGINYSDFTSADQLASRFQAYYSAKGLNKPIDQTNFWKDALKIDLKAVRNEMRYDQSEFIIPAGKPVEISFENLDLMQHNLLIVAPGSLEIVGNAADGLAQQPEGQQQQYIPDIPQVLQASALIDPGGSATLRFIAPQEPGNYPFVCTFPGHWRTMNGVLKVEGVSN